MRVEFKDFLWIWLTFVRHGLRQDTIKQYAQHMQPYPQSML